MAVTGNQEDLGSVLFDLDESFLRDSIAFPFLSYTSLYRSYQYVEVKSFVSVIRIF
jgi:hypothetical protein